MTVMRIGNRIPRTFFHTTGVGESDVTIHAGSYHLALHSAGIEMANIMTYSSILPKTAERIEKPDKITHGEVMETITAVSHVGPGERATAGIIYAWLYDLSTGDKYGGLVCEYGGSMDERDSRVHLRAMLDELYTNGYEHLALGHPEYLISSFVPSKAYGTALAALCFTSYDVPVVA